MFRLLFHVIAHVYHAHFREIVLLQLHAHLNALFAHFVGFSYTFSLIEEKELEVSLYLTKSSNYSENELYNTPKVKYYSNIIL
jgi:hypothetical protein